MVFVSFKAVHNFSEVYFMIPVEQHCIYSDALCRVQVSGTVVNKNALVRTALYILRENTKNTDFGVSHMDSPADNAGFKILMKPMQFKQILSPFFHIV